MYYEVPVEHIKNGFEFLISKEVPQDQADTSYCNFCLHIQDSHDVRE